MVKVCLQLLFERCNLFFGYLIETFEFKSLLQVLEYFYADEIMDLEQNLITIVENTKKKSYGTSPTYVANGLIMDYAELNRLESAILDLYDKLTNQSEGRRCFIWNFGKRGGIL